MAIGIELIKQLREETGAGVLDCRKALETYNGDFSKAIEYLREKGLAKAAKRADREVLEGMLELYSHGNGRVGVMVEVNCETDFVARSAAFRKFAHEVALQIAAGAPKWVRVEEIPAEVLDQEREKARNLALAEGKSEKVIERIVEGKLTSVMKKLPLRIYATKTLPPSVRTSSSEDLPAGKWAKMLKHSKNSQPSGWLFC
jgi:elongation factor Ts